MEIIKQFIDRDSCIIIADYLSHPPYWRRQMKIHVLPDIANYRMRGYHCGIMAGMYC